MTTAANRWCPALAAGMAAAVICFYAWTVTSNSTGRQPLFGDRQEDYYNQLLRAFAAGHLYLATAPDPRLGISENPYDPAKRLPGTVVVHDASYFQGRYYIYFGVAPVLTLRAPWRLATGRDLPQNYAILFWVSGGFVAATALLLELRRRYFPEASAGMVLACVAVLGLAAMTHAVLRRTSTWEEPIAAGYCFAMFTLFSLERALHARNAAAWLALAGLSLGLAVGSRPNYIVGVVGLLPILAAIRRRDTGNARWIPALALGAALGAILLALGWYNYARFGNPFEFGARYQLNAEHVETERHFSFSYAWFNSWAYYLAPAQWSRYFPFVEPVRPRPLPPGYYGVEYVYGLLANAPFALLALLAPLALRHRASAERDRLGAFLGATAFFCLSVSALLLTRLGAAARYMVDFAPSLMLLACVGLLGAERAFAGWSRAALRAIAAAAAAFSVFVGLMLNLQLHELLRQLNPELQQRIAHAFDFPVYWGERLAGARWGPIRLSLQFPKGRSGTLEPLVTTGWEYYSDYFFAYYIDDRHLKFGFDHAGHGLVWSQPLTVDYGARHELKLQMGSLFPPRAHPYFDGLSPRAIDDLTRWLHLDLDGRRVFDVRQDFYDGSPESLRIGGDPNRAAYGERFTGHLFKTELANGAMPMSYGAAELRLTLPLQASDRALPLVATGRAGSGDLLFVRMAPTGLARFYYDHWGEVFRSDEMPVAIGEPHLLRVSLPSLLPPGGTPREEALRESLRLWLDGRMIWVQQVPFFPARPEEAVFGRNAIGATSCEPAFPGDVIPVVRSPGAGPAGGPIAGPLSLLLRLPEDRMGRHEPLVATGLPGRADLLSIEYVDATHVRFGLDHWGVSFNESDPVTTDYGRIHELEIRLPTLDWPIPADGGKFEGRMTVLLDGAVVWRSTGEFYRAAPSSLEIGANRIGGSTCDATFTGGIAGFGSGAAAAPDQP